MELAIDCPLSTALLVSHPPKDSDLTPIMSTDPNKPSPSDGYPYNIISSQDARDLSDIFKPQGWGYLVVGNVSDSIAACSQAGGGAFVNESTKAITDLPVYCCCGFEKEADLEAVTREYNKMNQSWNPGPPAWVFAVNVNAALPQLGEW